MFGWVCTFSSFLLGVPGCNFIFVVVVVTGIAVVIIVCSRLLIVAHLSAGDAREREAREG